MWEEYQSNNCSSFFRDIWVETNPEVCDPLTEKINTITENLYIYDILRPIPAGALSKSRNPDFRAGKTVVGGTERSYKRGYTMAEYTPWLKHPLISEKSMGDHVFGAFLSDYVNDPKQRELLHIPEDVP